MKHTAIVIVLAIILGIASVASAANLTLCVDDRDWYPFIFHDGGQIHGMHIDIVQKALTSLGHTLTILAIPHNRAIFTVANGKADGMISVCYQTNLAQSLLFPPGAETDQESKWRIMQVDQVVITPISDPYEYAGDLASLPVPVRIPNGEPFSDALKAAGLKIDEARTDTLNFSKLLRDNNGCVITTTVTAESMNRDPAMAGKFRISATPIASKSYYLAFSPRSKLSQKDIDAAWEAIARWRDDYVFMLQVFARY